MIILSVDTSGRDGSVALAAGDANSFEMLESRTLTGGMYSAELVPRIAEMLAARNLKNSDIDLFAVCSGPGSFTGLRVGLSSVKALAEVLSKPLVASTALEAICVNAAEGSGTVRLIAVLDAQRGEVFCGEYDVKSGKGDRIAESLMRFEDFVLGWSATSKSIRVYSPDRAVIARLVEAGVDATEIGRPTADSYAKIGLRKFLDGQTVRPEELDADYIRRSDAEIFSMPKK